MNKIKRLLIGPASWITALFLFTYLLIQAPEPNLAPKEMQSLPQVQTTLDIKTPGMYNLFYLVPLDLSTDSNESDVRTSLSGSEYFQNIAEKVGLTKATIYEAKTDSALYQERDSSVNVFKGGKPEAWIAARSVCCFLIKNPGTYKFDVRKDAELKEPGCDFAIGIIPARPKTDVGKSLSYLLAFLILPLGYVGVCWILMIMTPWKHLADKYAHDCNLNQMILVDSGASLGAIKTQILPGKLFMRETPRGLELAVNGLTRHIGFNDLLIPWSAFANATIVGDTTILTLKESVGRIEFPSGIIKEAPGHVQAKGTEDLNKENEANLGSAKTIRVAGGIFIMIIGAVMSKFFVFDILLAAQKHAAVIRYHDALVLFSIFFVVLGIYMIGEGILKAPAQLLHEKQNPDVKKQRMLGYLLCIPAALFWLWFHWQLTQYGYPCFS